MKNFVFVKQNINQGIEFVCLTCQSRLEPNSLKKIVFRHLKRKFLSEKLCQALDFSAI